MAMSSPEEYVLQRWSANMMLQKRASERVSLVFLRSKVEDQNGDQIIKALGNHIKELNCS